MICYSYLVHQLNLWRPSSDLQSLLKEGCRYKVYNLTTSDGKKHGAVQLTGSKKTRFQDLQVLWKQTLDSVSILNCRNSIYKVFNMYYLYIIQAPQEWLSTRFQPRVSTRTVDLQKPEFQSLCGEVDVTGYVISIIDGQGRFICLLTISAITKVSCLLNDCPCFWTQVSLLRFMWPTGNSTLLKCAVSAALLSPAWRSW